MAKKPTLKFTFRQHRNALELAIGRYEKVKAAWLAGQPVGMAMHEYVYPEQTAIDTLKEAVQVFRNLEYIGTWDGQMPVVQGQLFQ